jgi:RimJ/RimL family protein N-acetyltransferase
MARMSLPTPTLRTARLRLRPFNDADTGALFVLHSNSYVLRYWDAPPWTERVRAERFIVACRQMAEEGSGARLAVDRLSDEAFIGWCSLPGGTRTTAARRVTPAESSLLDRRGRHQALGGWRSPRPRTASGER